MSQPPVPPSSVSAPAPDLDPARLDVAKKALRVDCLARRKLARANGAQAAERLIAHFALKFRPRPGAVLAGYWPMGDEIDVRPLLDWAATQAGLKIALPVVVRRGHPLAFRLWRPGDALASGPHGTVHPVETAPEIRPDVVLVPLLAFDSDGYRLGYGGGYYDRSLAALRGSGGKVLAIGIGYEMQRVATLPHGPYDEPLDWVMTEQSAHPTGQTGHNE